MKQYVGSFPVNMGLTRKLGYEGFVVYRDPEVGLYAYSDDEKLDVNLGTWNETVKTVSNDTLDMWRDMIANAIESDGFWTSEWERYC